MGVVVKSRKKGYWGSSYEQKKGIWGKYHEQKKGVWGVVVMSRKKWYKKRRIGEQG